MLSAYPHIEEFVDKKVANYDNVDVRFRLGASPKLHLLSEDQRDTIRIDHWKTEEIEEYLRNKLDTEANFDKDKNS